MKYGEAMCGDVKNAQSKNVCMCWKKQTSHSVGRNKKRNDMFATGKLRRRQGREKQYL